MQQLTVKVLKDLLSKMPEDAIVYLGNDEELNGIHGAYFCQKVSGEEVSEMSYGDITTKGVLIS